MSVSIWRIPNLFKKPPEVKSPSDHPPKHIKLELTESEKKALDELEKAKTKPVICALRTNVAFDGGTCLDVPVEGHAVSFTVKDFLHIKHSYNRDWWIGRVVRINSQLGFIPSPERLARLKKPDLHLQMPDHFESDPNFMGNNIMSPPAGVLSPGVASAGVNQAPLRPLGVGPGNAGPAGRVASEAPGGPKSAPPTIMANRHNFTNLNTDNNSNNPAIMIEISPEEADNFGTSNNAYEATGTMNIPTTPAITKSGLATPGIAAAKKKAFFKKADLLPPYEVVPVMRPLVFVGPALKGYEVTDMMQKALFDSLKKNLEGRLIITRVSADISNAKKAPSVVTERKTPTSLRNRPSSSRWSGHLSLQLLSDRNLGCEDFRRYDEDNAEEVQQEMDRIFELASTMQLLLLDCDTINHPNQLKNTNLAPLLVYVKISSLKVLTRLIKNRGKQQKKNLAVQCTAAERLLQCPPEYFDLVLDQSSLTEASSRLYEFLEAYWLATHPSNMQTKAERLLGGSTNAPNGQKARRNPIDPMAVQIMAQLGVMNQLSAQNNPASGLADDEEDLLWGGDPEEYRSDREMRVDNKERTNTAAGHTQYIANIPIALAPDKETESKMLAAMNANPMKSRSARQQKGVNDNIDEDGGNDMPTPRPRRLRNANQPPTNRTGTSR